MRPPSAAIVLLLLGANLAWSQYYPNSAMIIQIDVDPMNIGGRHPVTIGAVGNIRGTLEALLPRLEQHEDGAFLAAHVERLQKDAATAKAETVLSPDSVNSGTYLTKIINKHAAEDALFAAGDGEFGRCWKPLTNAGSLRIFMLFRISIDFCRETYRILIRCPSGYADASATAFDLGEDRHPPRRARAQRHTRSSGFPFTSRCARIK